MSKSTLRRLSKTMPDDEALEFLSTYFPCVAQLEAENEKLREATKCTISSLDVGLMLGEGEDPRTERNMIKALLMDALLTTPQILQSQIFRRRRERMNDVVRKSISESG